MAYPTPEREGSFWSLARTFDIHSAEDFKRRTGYDMPDDEHRAMAVLGAWGYPDDPRYDDIRRELGAPEREVPDDKAFSITPEIDAAISHALNTWYGYGAVHGNLNRKPAREAQFKLRQAIAAALELERAAIPVAFAEKALEWHRIADEEYGRDPADDEAVAFFEAVLAAALEPEKEQMPPPGASNIVVRGPNPLPPPEDVRNQ